MRLEFDAVTKTYGPVVALDDVTFDIPSGSTFGVLGTNGAGKTTLFELLVGHDVTDDGSIDVGGLDVADAGERVRERVGFLPEQVGFPDLLTGREVLRVHARIRGLGAERETRMDEVLETVGLADAADRRVEGYSNGMRSRLGLAAALLDEPPVLVLDEPTAGLDPRGVETFHRIVERIGRERDATVVLSSHVLDEVERLCDAVAILHEGQLCAVGDIDELRLDAAGATEITVHTATDDAAASVVETARPHGTVTVGEDRVVIRCPPDAVFDLVSAIDDTDLSGLEVRPPGLDAAFHEAIDAVAGDRALEVAES